jgi:hypothetical protein
VKPEDLGILIMVAMVIVGTVVVIAWAVYWDYQKKRLKFEERRAMIEKGMEPPPPAPHVLAGWPGVRQQELQLKFAERRLMIEKGLAPPEEPAKRPATRPELLRRGVLMLCVAAGIGAAAVLLNFVPAARVPEVFDAQAWGLGLAPIIGALGLGHIVAARFALTGGEGEERPTTRAPR